MPGAHELERERRLFASCLDRTQAERDDYLSRECGGDTELRERIERLLQAHSRATSCGLLSVPVDDIPDLIGRYQLTRVIGEGGMGTVYEAEQQEPVCRTVALKIVKLSRAPENGARSIIERFMAERQTLALMDHPNVAKVFDAGETLFGYPYFVMELVKGSPITDYCDVRRLSIRDRLRLFVQLCQAVQHAHQKGVIHRDLKPSNVLVGDESGDALAKVIDFGIAKAVGEQAACSGITRTGHPLGTAAYMSPEQAGSGADDVDTRSDIYSLGVILYELLTGTLPADPAATGYGSFLARLARGELGIQLPSVRLSSAGADAQQQVAIRRDSTPRNLARAIRGDLDWIVMRAIDSNRSARYASAAAFADDIERFLRNEPISARRPTIAYRSAKFIHRHRFQAAAAAIAAVAVIGGTAAAGVGYVRATRAQAKAVEQAAAAREVSAFLVDLFSMSDPNNLPGSPTTARDLLERGTKKVETELGKQPRVQANLLGTLGHVYESLGQYRRAGELAAKAVAVTAAAKLDEDADTAEALLTLGRVEQRLGRFEPARAALQHALDLRLRLSGENDLRVSVILNNLGAVYGQWEKFDQGLAAHERALAIQRRVGGPGHVTTYNSLRGIGIIHDRKGEWQAALDAFRAAQPVVEKRYGPNSRALADGLNNMGRMLFRLHRYDEARKLYERALELHRLHSPPQDPARTFVLHGLANVLQEEGRLDEALAAYREAIRIRETAFGADTVRTADLLLSLGRLQMRRGEAEEAQRLLARTFDIYRRAYGPDHSETLESRKALALALVRGSRYDDALPHLRDMIARNLPPELRIDLQDATFDKMRTRPTFRTLELTAQARSRTR